MATIEIRRMAPGPSLLIHGAEFLALDFFHHDPSAAPGGFDELAGKGESDRVTREDVVAINRTMRARSPQQAWQVLTDSVGAHDWLRAIDPDWDLLGVDDAAWSAEVRPAIALALKEVIAPYRGLSVATKVLHLKRPRLFPVLDSLVLQQVGVTESIAPLAVIDHLRLEGRRNAPELNTIRELTAKDGYDRPLIRILDVVLWASHPAAGLSPKLTQWRHEFRRTQ
jgi:uncharacterized protein DUF6308